MKVRPTISLALVKQIARRYLPNAAILGRRLPRSVLDIAWRDFGVPIIVYETHQAPRDRALTIFHEVAHHVYGDTDVATVAASGRATGGAV